MAVRRIIGIAAALIGLGGPALAQQFLYTPLPPKGSAYVRFVNALDAAASLKPDFGVAETVGATPADRVAAYAVVEHVAGRKLVVDITAGARHGHGTLSAAEGSFVTVILRPDGAAGVAVVPVVDQTDFNQTKSHLMFYNATPLCTSADLKLLPSNAAVFTGVAVGTAKTRSVNPVTATVVPYCGTTAGPSVLLQKLEAGAMYSIWLMQPQPGQPVSFISRDVTLPYKP